jgi:hypothetical protein
VQEGAGDFEAVFSIPPLPRLGVTVSYLKFGSTNGLGILLRFYGSCGVCCTCATDDALMRKGERS